MSLVVHRPGLLTTVQDLGRWGYQSAGVPVTGPMDTWSQRLANLVLGNPENAPVLEVTVTGPLFECDADVWLAITGAPFGIRVGQEDVRSPRVLHAGAGTTIDLLECLAGTRAYIAVPGGFDVPVVLGSRSTDLRGGFGGCAGRAIRSGDRLQHGAASVRVRAREVRTAAEAPARDVVTRLRVLRGPWQDPRADRVFAQLLGGSFRISSRSDRMGYRLEGGAVDRLTTASLITAPTTMGLVQVPPSGEPILLMADRQTTGGYAGVAVVIAADLPRAGQLGPGHSIAFDSCTPDEAHRALVDSEAQLTRSVAAQQ
jgi:antagonist of KipI